MAGSGAAGLPPGSRGGKHEKSERICYFPLKKGPFRRTGRGPSPRCPSCPLTAKEALGGHPGGPFTGTQHKVVIKRIVFVRDRSQLVTRRGKFPCLSPPRSPGTGRRSCGRGRSAAPPGPAPGAGSGRGAAEVARRRSARPGPLSPPRWAAVSGGGRGVCGSAVAEGTLAGDGRGGWRSPGLGSGSAEGWTSVAGPGGRSGARAEGGAGSPRRLAGAGYRRCVRKGATAVREQPPVSRHRACVHAHTPHRHRWAVSWISEAAAWKQLGDSEEDSRISSIK